jgi:hypothetical protein
MALAVVAVAGWPLFFFVHFRYRKHWSIPAAVSLSVVLGYFAICLIAPLGLMTYPVQRDFGIAGVALLELVSLVATFFPHGFLITQAIRESRMRRASTGGEASEPTDPADSR